MSFTEVKRIIERLSLDNEFSFVEDLIIAIFFSTTMYVDNYWRYFLGNADTVVLVDIVGPHIITLTMLVFPVFCFMQLLRRTNMLFRIGYLLDEEKSLAVVQELRRFNLLYVGVVGSLFSLYLLGACINYFHPFVPMGILIVPGPVVYFSVLQIFGNLYLKRAKKIMEERFSLHFVDLKGVL